MTVVNGYCTAAEVRSQLGDSGSKLDGSLIDKAINASSRAIDRYCDRRFWKDASVTTRVYTADDPNTVYVDDISSTTGLVLATDPRLDASWSTTWTTADYRLEPRNVDVVAAGDQGAAFAWYRIVAIKNLTFPTDMFRDTVRVTARFGWSAVPDQVNTACVLKAVSLFRRKDAPFGVAGFGDFGPIRITRRDPDVLDLLAPFVLKAIA
jgi:hypothetical protein